MIQKAIQKHSNLKEETDRSSSQKLAEFNQLLQKHSGPVEYAGLDSYSLAKIKQNMSLLHGEWNLTDLEYQLSPENLEQRYGIGQSKKLELPHRISPFKQNATPTKSKASVSR